MRNIQPIKGLPFKVNPYVDITDQLPQRPNPNNPRVKEQITHISVHHSAVEGKDAFSYANTHVYSNGWPCIGYHLLVSGDKTYQVNDLLTFSYHTASNNSYTVGIAVSGDFTKRPLSDSERNNLYAGILTLMYLFDVPVEHVLGHKEFGLATSCPGFDMDRVRNDISDIQMQMEYMKSAEYATSKAYEIANQTIYLYNLMDQGNDGQKKWARTMLLKMYPFMRDQGLVK